MWMGDAGGGAGQHEDGEDLRLPILLGELELVTVHLEERHCAGEACGALVVVDDRDGADVGRDAAVSFRVEDGAAR